MKKEYHKPTIVIERFEMSQHIATCEHIMVANQAIREGCDADNPDNENQNQMPGYIEYQKQEGYPFRRDIPTVPPTVPDNLFYTDIAGTSCQINGENMYCNTNGGSDTFLFTS